MAARKAIPSKEQQERTRAAIKTSQLVNRLQAFALAEKDIEIDSARLKAIEILLRKSLPDLSSVTLGGDEGNPINLVHAIERRIVRPDNPNG
ncbi:hypothetical protein [Sinorhizobium meliloti]|uniref:hypothetical protein n=1 Tax=Rhizobium meliloti TaxID=382 RepID=UPI000FD940D8|nr:hypothetical protein [Sinorhizobium meliloti]RVI91815.1 hypothetical protein CN190_03475 [Sinorhizobium meliloti]